MVCDGVPDFGGVLAERAGIDQDAVELSGVSGVCFAGRGVGGVVGGDPGVAGCFGAQCEPAAEQASGGPGRSLDADAHVEASGVKVVYRWWAGEPGLLAQGEDGLAFGAAALCLPLSRSWEEEGVLGGCRQGCREAGRLEWKFGRNEGARIMTLK